MDTQPTLEGFDLPSELPPLVANGIQHRIAMLKHLSWEPKQGANEADRALFDMCPVCGILASTIALQLTYYAQEPTTLHMWCLAGHAWLWNEVEGRAMEPSKWMR